MHSREIVGKIYFGEYKKKKQILCIGQVQSGKTKFIIEETEKAIISGEYDCVIIIGGTNNILLNQTEKRFWSNDNIKSYNHINLSRGHNIKNLTLKNNRVIIYTLKGDDALRKVVKFVSLNSEFKYLIIDDESDYGSLNVSNNGLGSTIYNHILNIYNTAEYATYYSVTATPFANILDNSWNFDSVRYVMPSDDYCGIDFFFEKKLYECCDDLIITDKFNDSRIMSILRDHIKRIIENDITKSQILFNVDLSVNKQNELLREIKSCLEICLKIIWRDISENKHHLVVEVIDSLIKNTVKLNCNSTDDDKKRAKEKHSIIIGGNMVSRGFTFEELITCVMVNEPNKSKYSADTLLQRCRWFGYRKRKIPNSNIEQYKIMKVLTTSKIINCLEEAKELNNVITLNDNIDIMKNKIKSHKFKYIKPSQKK